MRRGEIPVSNLLSLRRLAARHAFTAEEADDLVQDVFLAALEQNRDCAGPNFLAWASGVIRRRALFLARGAGRRRRREARFADAMDAAPAPEMRLPPHSLATLPRSLRTVALLANAGLGRAEIGSLLALSDTALRQRISGLRRAWRRSGATADPPVRLLRHRPPCGLLRRSLKKGLTRLPQGRFAITDPDGHLIFVSAAHKSAARGN